jgi:hypothetical protein
LSNEGSVADSQGKPELILDLGCAGGTLLLIGIRKGGDWVFKCITDESFFAEFADFWEPGHTFTTESEWAPGWSGALALLGRYEWYRLYPIEVHAEFQGAFRAEIHCWYERMNEHQKKRWRRILRGGRQRRGASD